MDANERRARATDEATQWWNRLAIERSGHTSKADREQFTQWLRESPLHVAELLRIAQVHNALERFDLWGEIETGDPGEARNVIPLREVPAGSREVSSENLSPAESSSATDSTARGSRLRIWTIAASICFAAAIGGWLALGNRGQAVETELAERRQVMLDDGTVVQLEPETRMRVKFQDHERHVTLARGRALFRVAKDAQRPFWVSTGNTSVRAVGTAFGVESSTRSVIVTVAEGKVAVWHAADGQGGRAARTPGEHDNASGASSVEEGVGPSVAGSPASEVFLTAGQQLTVQSSGVAEPVRTVDTASALAWAHGQLVFENDTLADVVGEFNRYNRVQLRLSDSKLAGRRVSGVFEATDTETLLAFIRQGSSDITITQTDESIVIGSNTR